MRGVQDHDPLFKTHLKGTRLVGDVQTVRFLAKDVALIHASGSTIMSGETKPSPARDSIQTLVATRSGDDWLVTAFQNTRIRPIGRGSLGMMLWLIGGWLWNFALPSKGSGPEPHLLAARIYSEHEQATRRPEKTVKNVQLLSHGLSIQAVLVRRTDRSRETSGDEDQGENR
jgi:hypothetical protein